MTAIGSPIYRWRIGEVEITRVLEFEAALFEPAVLYPEAPSEIIERHCTWLEPPLMDPASGPARLRVSQHGSKDTARDHPGRHLLGQ